MMKIFSQAEDGKSLQQRLNAVKPKKESKGNSKGKTTQDKKKGKGCKEDETKKGCRRKQEKGKGRKHANKKQRMQGKVRAREL